MPNVVRIGDSTSHGGKVIESGAPHFIVGGKAIALVTNAFAPSKDTKTAVLPLAIRDN